MRDYDQDASVGDTRTRLQARLSSGSREPSAFFTGLTGSRSFLCLPARLVVDFPVLR